MSFISFYFISVQYYWNVHSSKLIWKVYALLVKYVHSFRVSKNFENKFTITDNIEE